MAPRTPSPLDPIGQGRALTRFVSMMSRLWIRLIGRRLFYGGLAISILATLILIVKDSLS